jgi:lipoprotein-anchoring transpeptidase ErfK/SrfK
MYCILSILIFILGFAMLPAGAREVVAIDGYHTGTIVISTHARKLYFVISADQAIQYPVGVGRKGKQWTGNTFISEKRVRPAWSPPESVKRAEPWLPDVIPPGPKNPMGSRALLLAGDEYAIHGTNKPESVGGFVSFGCIRMYNRDVEELFNYVKVGTPVIVTR